MASKIDCNFFSTILSIVIGLILFPSIASAQTLPAADGQQCMPSLSIGDGLAIIALCVSVATVVAGLFITICWCSFPTQLATFKNDLSTLQTTAAKKIDVDNLRKDLDTLQTTAARQTEMDSLRKDMDNYGAEMAKQKDLQDTMRTDMAYQRGMNDMAKQMVEEGMKRIKAEIQLEMLTKFLPPPIRRAAIDATAAAVADGGVGPSSSLPLALAWAPMDPQ